MTKEYIIQNGNLYKRTGTLGAFTYQDCHSGVTCDVLYGDWTWATPVDIINWRKKFGKVGENIEERVNNKSP